MAKTSAIERNLKRIRMAKKFEKKRKKLKAIISNKKLPLNERFAAQLKLSKLPKNSSKIRIMYKRYCCHNRTVSFSNKI